MLSAKDIKGMYAIIATPAKPGADRLDAVDTVDLDETARVINALIRDGSSGLIVLGTTGECATLSDPDYRAYVGCVAETVNRRIPLIVGTSALGGHEAVRRNRLAQDVGADGVLLGLPMWQPCTMPEALHFYAEMSEIFPNLAIMAYANARAFRFPFAADFWEAVVKVAPTVTSAKYSVPKGIKELVDATGGKINFVPHEGMVSEFFKRAPDSTTACWATASGMNPAPAVAIMNAIAEKNQPAIDLLAKAIAWASEPVEYMITNPELFTFYNIQMEKTRINAAGYSNVGPIRPPYGNFPEEHAAPAIECGKRWARVCAAYAGNYTFTERPWEAGNA